MMNIAIVGTGNVDSALATKWASKGHHIYLGVRDRDSFKGSGLLNNPNTSLHTIHEAVTLSEIVLISTPAPATVEVAKSLGDTSEKIIIDIMNILMGRGPLGYRTTTEAILAHTSSVKVVKCFNTTGFNNMLNPEYGHTALDMFVAGDSHSAKQKLLHDWH